MPHLFKLQGIVLDYGTLRAGHEPLKARGQQALAGRRQDAQQLLEGEKGSAHLEVHPHVGKVADVCDPGREMVGIVPGPGHTPVVVVVQVPLDGPDHDNSSAHLKGLSHEIEMG